MRKRHVLEGAQYQDSPFGCIVASRLDPYFLLTFA